MYEEEGIDVIHVKNQIKDIAVKTFIFAEESFKNFNKDSYFDHHQVGTAVLIAQNSDFLICRV